MAATISVSAAIWAGAVRRVGGAVNSTAARAPQAGGDVLGKSKSHGPGDEGDDKGSATRGPFGSPSLDLASPSRDLPFLLTIAVLAALFAWLLVRRARTATDRLEDPAKVERMRR